MMGNAVVTMSDQYLQPMCKRLGWVLMVIEALAMELVTMVNKK
jgi:hypothetical protein